MSSETSASSFKRQVSRAAGTVMAAFVFTQIIGLVRGFVVLRAFGTTAVMDSFNAANRVTEVLFNLMAGGALGSAFIPTFTGLLAHDQRERAWKLASSVANLLILVLTGVSLLAFIFAPQVVRYGLYVLNPGESAGQEQLTVELLRIMLPTVVIFGLSGLVMGILNAHQKFWLPAIAPAMYSIGQMLGVWLFPAEWGIQRLAYGALIGAAMHLLVQSPDLLRLHGRYSLTFGRRIAEVGEVIRLMGPRILGVAVVQANFFVNTIVGLSLPAGSVSALTLAFTWMMMPEVAIAQSVATALMPSLSAQAALQQWDDLRETLAASLRAVLLLAIPASVGLMLLRTPLLSIYEGGEFTVQSTQLAAWALLWYAAGLVFHSLVELLVRAFYALHDTRTPVSITFAAMSLNVLFSFTFPRWFATLGWLPVGGLALANSLATSLECLALIFFLRRRLGSLEGRKIAGAVLRALAAALLMGASVAGFLALNLPLAGALTVLLGAGIGAVIYAAALTALKTPEVFMLLRVARARLGR
jgi:putative peptidoglycan lipid II flippase